jgi:hypothetical protein
MLQTGEKKCDQERIREDFKTKRPYNRNTGHVGCKNKYDTSNNRGKTGTITKLFKKYPSNITGKHEIKELYKKLPYRALHTYCGKYECKSTERSTWEITVLVRYIVTTE